jgi:hypothetical protein
MARLIIDLRADFDRTAVNVVDVHLIKRITPKVPHVFYAEFIPTPGGDLRAGVRLTEVNDLTTGTYFLVVRLLDRHGASIGMRTTIVTLRGDLIVTAVIVP